MHRADEHRQRGAVGKRVAAAAALGDREQPLGLGPAAACGAGPGRERRDRRVPVERVGLDELVEPAAQRSRTSRRWSPGWPPRRQARATRSGSSAAAADATADSYMPFDSNQSAARLCRSGTSSGSSPRAGRAGSLGRGRGSGTNAGRRRQDEKAPASSSARSRRGEALARDGVAQRAAQPVEHGRPAGKCQLRVGQTTARPRRGSSRQRTRSPPGRGGQREPGGPALAPAPELRELGRRRRRRRSTGGASAASRAREGEVGGVELRDRAGGAEPGKGEFGARRPASTSVEPGSRARCSGREASWRRRPSAAGARRRRAAARRAVDRDPVAAGRGGAGRRQDRCRGRRPSASAAGRPSRRAHCAQSVVLPYPAGATMETSGVAASARSRLTSAVRETAPPAERQLRLEHDRPRGQDGAGAEQLERRRVGTVRPAQRPYEAWGAHAERHLPLSAAGTQSRIYADFSEGNRGRTPVVAPGGNVRCVRSGGREMRCR